MTTIYVWVLVFSMWDAPPGDYTAKAGGPAVIDNISTEQECLRVQSLLLKSAAARDSRKTRTHCIQVQKVVTK